MNFTDGKTERRKIIIVSTYYKGDVIEERKGTA